jgi:hypothetical protein
MPVRLLSAPSTAGDILPLERPGPEEVFERMGSAAAVGAPDCEAIRDPHKLPLSIALNRNQFPPAPPAAAKEPPLHPRKPDLQRGPHMFLGGRDAHVTGPGIVARPLSLACVCVRPLSGNPGPHMPAARGRPPARHALLPPSDCECDQRPPMHALQSPASLPLPSPPPAAASSPHPELTREPPTSLTRGPGLGTCPSKLGRFLRAGAGEGKEARWRE